MELNKKNIEIKFEVPKIPDSLSVYKVKAATLEERNPSIDILSKLLKFSKLYRVEVDDSVHILSKEGEIQYYRPSGALWARNLIDDLEFDNEERRWKTNTVTEEMDKDVVDLVLTEETKQEITEKGKKVFEKSKLLGKEAFFSDISLEQISTFDEKGNEINTIAGEATVKFLYKLNNILVDGGGAKSYAFFNPSEKENGLVGIYHAWREIVDSVKIRTRTMDEVVESALKTDGELRLYLKRNYKIQFNEVELVYYSLPPFKYQEVIFPVLKVLGSITSKGEKDQGNGFDFGRYYHLVQPNDYIESEMYAKYLMTGV